MSICMKLDSFDNKDWRYWENIKSKSRVSQAGLIDCE